MAETIAVTPSGTVGKAVFAATRKGRLLGYVLATSAAVGKIKFRHGVNNSGEVAWEDRTVPAAVSGEVAKQMFEGDQIIRFDRGMHVTVIGTGGIAYLLIG